jgi:flagellar basal body-associated protein FliL
MTNLSENMRDPEKRAKFLLWIWILSLIMTAVGYFLIFYFLFYI